MYVIHNKLWQNLVMYIICFICLLIHPNTLMTGICHSPTFKYFHQLSLHRDKISSYSITANIRSSNKHMISITVFSTYVATYIRTCVLQLATYIKLTIQGSYI